MSEKNIRARIARIALTTVIILSSVSLFLILVLKEYTINLGFFQVKIDNPIPWMLILFLALVLTYWLLNTGRIASNKNYLLTLLKKADIYHFLLLGIFMVCLYFFHCYGGRLGNDGITYFRWLRSFIFSGQPDAWNSEPFRFKVRYIFSPAFLWLPFFLIAHFLAWGASLFGRSISLNGSSYPYINAVCVSSLLYAFTAIILIYELLKKYFNKFVSFLSIVSLWIGTFLLWYMIYEPSMAQCTSFFSATLFIYVWFKHWDNRSLSGWLWLIVLSIFMIAVRPYNIVFLLFPFIEVIEEKIKLIKLKRWDTIKSSLKWEIPLLIASAASIYMIFHVIRGWELMQHPKVFNWTQPKIIELLFSSYHGLLSWSPLIYIALFGFPLMFKKHKRLSLYCLFTFLILIYVLSSVTDWYAGDSYGSRRFIGSLFIFSLTLAALIEWIKKHPYLLIGIIIGCFLVGNMLFMEQFRMGRVPHMDTISFKEAAQKEISSYYSRFGHPFSFPANLWFRLKYGVPVENFDQIFGHRAYHNIAVDIGDNKDVQFLGKGWYGRESYEGIFYFRWSKGKESNLIVNLFDAFDYQLELMAAPLIYQQSPEQMITVYVNGQEITRIRLKRGFHHYYITVAKTYWKKGINEIRFQYQFCQQPKFVMESSDERHLAVAFDYIRLQIIK